ncbi:MAG: hypothetical protein AAB460_02030 [Patescibacteria group bacterium]
MKKIFIGLIFLSFLFIVDQSFVSGDLPALTQQAFIECQAQRGTNTPPLPFHYDGCTLWPNGTWVECCAEHDSAYWCGGSAGDRLKADVALGICVNAKVPRIGSLMQRTVRVTGVPWMPWNVRWGFGWKYGKGYK